MEVVHELAVDLVSSPWLLKELLYTSGTEDTGAQPWAALFQRFVSDHVVRAGSCSDDGVHVVLRMLWHCAVANHNAAAALDESFGLSTSLAAAVRNCVTPVAEGEPVSVDALSLERWRLWSALGAAGNLGGIAPTVTPPPHDVNQAAEALRVALLEPSPEPELEPDAGVTERSAAAEAALTSFLQLPSDVNDSEALRTWWADATPEVLCRASAEPQAALVLLYRISASSDSSGSGSGDQREAALLRSRLQEVVPQEWGHDDAALLVQEIYTAQLLEPAMLLRVGEAVEALVEVELPQVAVAFERGKGGSSVAALARHWCWTCFCGVMVDWCVVNLQLSMHTHFLLC